jgi:hypothetical protein
MDVWAYILDDGITVAATADINSVPEGITPTKFVVDNFLKTNFKVENDQIVIDVDKSVLDAQQKQIRLISPQCASSITGGFYSGSNVYPSQQTDQMNIHSVALYGGSLWTLDASKNWLFVNYTAQEGQKIEQDMIAFIQSQQTIYANLVSEIKASSNISYINSITWPTPPTN